MTKTTKVTLSVLAASMLVTSLNAKSLEDAIKGVDVSGFVTYQYNDQTDTNQNGIKTSGNDNIYKLGATITAPATDDVKVKVGVSTRGVTADTTVLGTTTNDALGDQNPSLGLDQAAFVYTGIANATIMAGKQPLNTPWTQGTHNIDATQGGTGLLATYATSSITFGVGHFMNNSIRTGKTGTGTDAKVNIATNDITVALVNAQIEKIANIQLWYANVGDETGSSLEKGAKALNLSADAKMGDFKAIFGYSTLESDSYESGKKQTMTKVGISSKLANISGGLTLVKTGKDGGLVAFDSDGSAGLKGYSADFNGAQDAFGYVVTLGSDITTNLNLTANYIKGDIDKTPVATDDLKIEEMYATLTYKMAKNLSIMGRYSNYTEETNDIKTKDRDRGRLQISYSF